MGDKYMMRLNQPVRGERGRHTDPGAAVRTPAKPWEPMTQRR